MAERPAVAGNQVVLRLNDFPYFLESMCVVVSCVPGSLRLTAPLLIIKDGIAHYVLWFEDGRIPDDQAVAAILTEKLEHRDVLWFENPAVVRSLPGLAHIHVFAR